MVYRFKTKFKCEISGIGTLKGAAVAVCGIKCIDLTKECMKIFGLCYSNNWKLQIEKTFLKTVKNMKTVSFSYSKQKNNNT